MKKIVFYIVKKIIKYKRIKLGNKKINNPKKILIVRNDHLGDLVLSLPAIKRVREAYPNAYIAVLINPAYKAIFHYCDIVSEVICYNKQGAKLQKIKVWFKLVIKCFDVSLDLAHGDTLDAAVLAFCAFIPNRIGYDVGKHGFLYTKSVCASKNINITFETDIANNIVSLLCKKKTKEEKVQLMLDDRCLQFWQEQLNSSSNFIIGVNIGVSDLNPIKAWDIKKFASLINKIKSQYSCQIVLIGTKEEQQKYDILKQYLEYDVINLIGKTNVSDLIHVLSCFNLFICNNTGSMQLSVLLDVPSVVINGPSSVGRWGPNNLDKHLIVRKDLECNVMDCDGKICTQDYYCIKGIEVDEVYEKIKENCIV